jgi:hypothetical protein
VLVCFVAITTGAVGAAIGCWAHAEVKVARRKTAPPHTLAFRTHPSSQTLAHLLSISPTSLLILNPAARHCARNSAHTHPPDRPTITTYKRKLPLTSGALFGNCSRVAGRQFVSLVSRGIAPSICFSMASEAVALQRKVGRGFSYHLRRVSNCAISQDEAYNPPSCPAYPEPSEKSPPRNPARVNGFCLYHHHRDASQLL